MATLSLVRGTVLQGLLPGPAYWMGISLSGYHDVEKGVYRGQLSLRAVSWNPPDHVEVFDHILLPQIVFQYFAVPTMFNWMKS
jgi:hypothetical protein